MTEKIKSVMNALENNGIKVIYVEKKEDVPEIVKGLLNKGDSVAVGGSVSIKEAGVYDLLKNGDYNFYDRYAYTDRDKIEEIYKQSFSVDAYFCSSNAITESGELYNVDGNNNRVAAILYGPKSVIMVAGVNKIVKDLDEAINRVKTIAAPKNVKRLELKTYCYAKGHCMAIDKGQTDMCSGCKSDVRICRNFVVSGPQKIKDRIKVILVNEELGY